jgi:23S rRNA (pseudouridine1915-N3)-methyltransferase
MKLRVLSVGKDKGETLALAQEYAGRIARFAEIELVELKAEGPAREADALRGKFLKGESWALDQRGSELTSEELAARIAPLRSGALTLCIGGDEGLDTGLTAQARFVWSLSKLTLPHRLARVLVLEQLYRSFEILRGAPYHK